MCTYVLVQTLCYSYIPYIIIVMSPTYIPVEVVVELKNKIKWMTQEKLIGIISGSVSLFFIIFMIIIYIYKKRYNDRIVLYEEEEEENSYSYVKQTNINSIEFDTTLNNDIDNWI